MLYAVKFRKMVDFDTIRQALLDNGYADDTASMLAEKLIDWGWEDIRDILNNL